MRKILFGLTLLIATTAFGQGRFAITGSAVRSNARTAATVGIGDTLRYGSDTGYGLALDYFWTPSLATEVSASWTKPSLMERASTGTATLGDAKMMPVTASLQWHFMPMSWADWYVGAGGAWVKFSDIKSSDALSALDIDRVKFKSRSAAMAQAGATFGSWRGFGLNLDAKYMNLKTKSQAMFTDNTSSRALELKVSPWLMSAGIRYRF